MTSRGQGQGGAHHQFAPVRDLGEGEASPRYSIVRGRRFGCGDRDHYFFVPALAGALAGLAGLAADAASHTVLVIRRATT